MSQIDNNQFLVDEDAITSVIAADLEHILNSPILPFIIIGIILLIIGIVLFIKFLPRIVLMLSSFVERLSSKGKKDKFK